MEYTRQKLKQLGKTDDHSLRYWRKQAKDILDQHPEIETVKIARSGNKTDILPRGVSYPEDGVYVIIASTGGKYGKSRREYPPRNYVSRYTPSIFEVPYDKNIHPGW